MKKNEVFDLLDFMGYRDDKKEELFARYLSSRNLTVLMTNLECRTCNAFIASRGMLVPKGYGDFYCINGHSNHAVIYPSISTHEK